MLERHEHLFYCKQCKNQDFDTKQGLICKLTGTLADFDPVCPNFKSISGEYGSTEFEAVRKKIDQVNNKLAKTGLRFANYLIDSFVIWLTSLIIIIFLTSSGTNTRFSETEFYIFYFILTILYYTIFETLTGKTPAKFVTKTRVVTEDGFPPTFQNILGRTMCRFIPFEPFSFFGSEIGWHDSISKTLVIREDGAKSDNRNF
jgi:uncharacterized RDD family membrane protein YckC